MFASALRLEVKHLGVDVGSAHMSWIDTPLVQDAKKDLSAFAEMLSNLPGPLSQTTTVDKCVDAFIAGLEKRKRRVYVPGWVGAIGTLRSVITSTIGEKSSLQQAPHIIPKMDAEVAALGRSTSAATSSPAPWWSQATDGAVSRRRARTTAATRQVARAISATTVCDVDSGSPVIPSNPIPSVRGV